MTGTRRRGGRSARADADGRVRALAQRQLGLISRDQLEELGLSAQQVWRRVRSGSLERVGPFVYRIGGAPVDDRHRVLAAILDAGIDAAASFGTCARLWKLPGYSIDPIEVTRFGRRNRRRSDLAVVHEPKLLRPEHLVAMGPLVVTTPSRLLFDLAGRVHIDKLRRTTDDVLAKRLSNVAALHQMLGLLAAKGRRGIRNMREVLEERPVGYRPPESHLEARVQQILVSGGYTGFERQVDVGDDAGWIGRVDFLERATGAILQVDGDRWHSQLVDRVADAAQVERLERAGFVVGRIPESHVWLHPGRVLATAHTTRTRALALRCGELAPGEPWPKQR